jgi:uncharacterized protein
MQPRGGVLERGVWDGARRGAGVHVSAKVGDPQGQLALGVCYYYGQGAEQDDVCAAELWEKAAVHSHPGALSNLTMYYQAGRGVALDPAKTMALLDHATTAGSTHAQHNLALAYIFGFHSLPRDIEKVRSLFEAAATTTDHIPARTTLTTYFPQYETDNDSMC